MEEGSKKLCACICSKEQEPEMLQRAGPRGRQYTSFYHTHWAVNAEIDVCTAPVSANPTGGEKGGGMWVGGDC